MNKKEKLPTVAIGVIVVLAVRTLAQFLAGAGAFTVEGGAGIGLLLIGLGLIHVAAIVGTVKRKQWGTVLVMVIAIFDGIVAALATTGSAMLGALTVDVILLWMATADYKLMKK